MHQCIASKLSANMENRWKVYLDTVYHSQNELENYARQNNLLGDHNIQEIMMELRGKTGKPAQLTHIVMQLTFNSHCNALQCTF